MGFFVIDEKKCTGDRKCVEECPMGIIEIKDPKGFPTAISGADELCINCGHCVALCPTGAFSLNTLRPEQCLPVNPEWPFKPEQAKQLLQARRSIRSFKDKAVDRDILAELIDIARFAPSGRNTQPVGWMVIQQQEEIHQLEGMVVDWMRSMIKDNAKAAARLNLDRIVAAREAGKKSIITCDAPHMIISFTPKNAVAGVEAGVIAMTYLELAAPSYGLGACWAGYFNSAAKFWKPMKEALGLPEKNEPVGAMMIGYPKYKYHRIPLRNTARITWR